MLVCKIASTLPTIIVRAESTARMGARLAASEGNNARKTRIKAAKAAALTPTDMKAVTGEGAPW